MIKATSENDAVRVEASGTFNEIFIDLMAIIVGVYGEFPSDAQEHFRELLTKVVTDENNSIWEVNA